jgi:hypothetical protein
VPGPACVLGVPSADSFAGPFGRYFCKRSPVLVDPGILARKGLPPKHRDFRRHAGPAKVDQKSACRPRNRGASRSHRQDYGRRNAGRVCQRSRCGAGPNPNRSNRPRAAYVECSPAYRGNGLSREDLFGRSRRRIPEGLSATKPTENRAVWPQ